MTEHYVCENCGNAIMKPAIVPLDVFYNPDKAANKCDTCGHETEVATLTRQREDR